MRRSSAILVIVILALWAPRNAAAHGENAVLYVAEGGDDSGPCNDAAAPCRSIGFALGRAGKATEIRVAAGNYELDGAETLFHVLSGIVDVRGGFDRDDGFDTPDVTVSTLTGVPLQYRQALTARAFHVIVDRKGSPDARARATDKMLDVHRSLKSGAPSAACVNGMSGDLACEDVDLVGHIAFNDFRTRPGESNDIWGFVDLNSGREYVIAGFNTGTAVLDIGDPDDPREVGFVPGQNSTWRDVKVLQRYDAGQGRWRAWAYVTTDRSTEGLFIIDLAGLPHSIERVAYQSDFQSNHNLLLTNTEPSTGLPARDGPQHLILAGSNRNAGQARAYALDDPASPTLAQGDAIPNNLPAGDPSYAHDVAWLAVDDSRVAQCPNATTRCDLLLDFNEENVEVWDMTDIADPVLLNAGQPQYPQRGYVHSGWPTEDGQFMFVQDELDEQTFGINTRLRVFSIADLANPVLIETWDGPTPATDHNGFVRGNRYYMSNYRRGLTVLDITDPTNLDDVGRLDTYPFSDTGGYFGAWGVYPYFPSGIVAISDIDSGVYLARDRTRLVPQGQFNFDQTQSYGVVEGDDASLIVSRDTDSAGAVSVDYQVIHATADDADYTLTSGTLDWADGDDLPRQITLSAISDGVAEGMELLLVRLVNPAGGATLGDANMARVYLSDPGEATTIRAFADAIDVSEDSYGRAIVILNRQGSAIGEVTVDLAVTGGTADTNDYSGSGSATITWPHGDADPKTVAYDIRNDGNVEDEEFFEVTLSNPTGGTLAGSTTVRITIAADGSPPPPSGGGGSSGGAAAWLLLLLLVGAVARIHYRFTSPMALARGCGCGSGVPPRIIESRRDAAPTNPRPRSSAIGVIRKDACG